MSGLLPRFLPAQTQTFQVDCNEFGVFQNYLHPVFNSKKSDKKKKDAIRSRLRRDQPSYSYAVASWRP
jgi:hypothetical protein